MIYKLFTVNKQFKLHKQKIVTKLQTIEPQVTKLYQAKENSNEIHIWVPT